MLAAGDKSQHLAEKWGENFDISADADNFKDMGDRVFEGYYKYVQFSEKKVKHGIFEWNMYKEEGGEHERKAEKNC